MTENSTFQIGVTFHSFTNEYTSYKWSFEDLMVLAAQLGRGIEIVGPSHHRGFPEVTDEFERTFKSSVERNGLIPTCYGTYADPFMLPHRDLTPDEIFEYTIPQIKGAAKLGFPIARLQYFTHEVAEKLIPYAEKYNVKMGYELHMPLMIKSDYAQMLIAQVRRISSEYLGIIPDGGIFGKSITKRTLNMAKGYGVPQNLVAKAVELWGQQLSLEEALEKLKEMGADENAIAWVDFVWDMNGWSDPNDMAEFKDYLIHFHGKFYCMEDGEDPNLDYDGVVKALLDLGYTGWISSEYEGEPTDTLAVVREQQAMLKRYIKQHAG